MSNELYTPDASKLELMTGFLPVEKALIDTANPRENLMGIDVEGYSIVMDAEVHRRIVACVNSCRGIDTEWLESASGSGIGIQIVGMRNDLTRCIRERDEASAKADDLLEALQGLLFDLNSHTSHPSVIKARKAIAKATGGTE